jgi:RNA polymerase sigma-70 factor (ECF subfamily)
MPDISDAALLLRFRSGDALALDSLFERYEAPLFQFLLGLLKDHHRAEDALQETFVRALSRLDGVDPDHLRGWLFTVAYHEAMLQRRREKTRAADPLPAADDFADDGPDPYREVELADQAQRLHYLIGRLPAAQQEVIRQRVYEGKRFRDIAQSLDCPLNTALARMHEGLKRLRHLWENEHA